MASRDDHPPTGTEQDAPQRIKVKRSRRRLYEEPSGEAEPSGQASPRRPSRRRSSRKPAATGKASGRAVAAGTVAAEASAAEATAAKDKPSAGARRAATKSTAKKKITARKKTAKKKAVLKKTVPKKAAAVAAATVGADVASTTKRNSTSGPADDGSVLRQQEARKRVMKYVLLSSAAGFIPVPFVDLAALSVLQLRMLKELTTVYGVEYSEERARIYLGTLVSTLTPLTLCRPAGMLRAFVRSVPVVGTAASLAVFPGTLGASTYALGQIFIQHFENGGSLIDFDPKKAGVG